LAPPGGERWSSRSAHVKRRCTFIRVRLFCNDTVDPGFLFLY
jgi:hypothetical protein